MSAWPHSAVLLSDAVKDELYLATRKGDDGVTYCDNHHRHQPGELPDDCPTCARYVRLEARLKSSEAAYARENP